MEGFAARLPCDVSRLAELRHKLGEWLDASELPDPLRSSVVLVTHEAAANAIEHPVPCEAIEVRAAIDAETLTVAVAVTDSGVWKHANLDDEGGRGLTMISVLMPQVEITTEATGTTVRMRAALARATSAR